MFSDDHTVYIQLGNNCRNDPELAHYQLAHETVHLLSPVKRESVTVLEEGVATRFGCDFMVNRYPNLGWPKPRNWSSTGEKEYNRAMVLADGILSKHHDAIRCLRQIQSAISKIGLETIRSRFPGLSPDDATELCMRFEEWKIMKGFACGSADQGQKR